MKSISLPPSAPAAGRIHAVDEGLDALLDFPLGKIIHLDKGRKVGIKRGKCLRAGPFILHDAEEIHHLVAEGGKVVGGRGCNLSRNASESLLDQLLQAPARAVSGEHGKVVQMDRRAAVRSGDFIVIDLAQPVVGRDGAGVGKNQSAHRVGDRRILLDAPVIDLQIVVDDLLVVQERRIDVAYLLALSAVKNICFCHVGIAGLGEYLLNTVLDILNRDLFVDDLALEVGRNMQRDQFNHARMILFFQCAERLRDGVRDLADLKFYDLTVSFYYFIQSRIAPFRMCARLFPFSRAESMIAPEGE